MGCAASKGAAVASPAYEVTTSSSSASSYSVSRSASTGAAVEVASIWSRPVRLDAYEDDGDGKKKASAAAARGGVECSSVVVGGGVRLGNIHRYVEAEQVAAGWPSWLSAAAAEAVHGWVPLKAANFEKLDKIGQGTYSSVFRARNLETGKMVALKKVRFDSGEPESVRFMAREILILRRLHRHPNVVSLDGLITSSSSPNLYLVFDYSHHDLAGLSSDPSLSFSLPEIKCYMRQLLLGLEHCHARGVMHRDIKCANLLVSDGGELKVADFGLANVFDASAARSAAMTSRVVTLWYRPPELLLGATAYDASVDLWSAGCVFAEMHARRPILQGRTEVEQIHRIFKLCGSPGDGYWRRAAAGGGGGAGFRPQQPYESRLRETFGDMMPDDAFRLLSTLLSVEPSARGTATEALASEYFRTEPYACEPSSLPKHAPNKEMDAKLREDSRRKGNIGRNHGGGEATKRLSRGHKSMQDTAAAAAAAVASQRHGHGHGHIHAEESLPRANGGAAGEARLFVDLQPVPVIASKRHDDPPPPPPLSRSFQNDDDTPPRLADRLPLSGPVQLTASTGFAWAKKPRPDSTTTTTTTTKRCSSKVPRTNSNGAVHAAGAYEAEKQEAIKQWAQVANAFTSSESYNNRFREPTMATAAAATKQLKSSKKHKVGGEGGGGRMHRVGFSGPLLSQPRRIDELLENHEQQIRRAGRRSWFRKGSKKEQQ